MGLKIEQLPTECVYCDKPAKVEVIKTRLLSKTSVPTCRECAKMIWREETNRTLP